MPQNNDQRDNYDITNELIGEGDWLVIPASGGGMVPMRWGKVEGFSPLGWPKVQTFQVHYGHWMLHPQRPTNLMIPEKSWIIGYSALPKGLLEYIDDAFGGEAQSHKK